jgi:hypothetical protein
MYRFDVATPVLGLILQTLVAFPANSACPRHVSPGEFENPSAAWNGTDTGVVIDGFADLKAPDGGTLAVVHGVDLSQHNSVDYEKVKECGAQFSFLRVDEQFVLHAERLRTLNIEVIPYYFFPIPRELRTKALYQGQNEQMSKASLNRFEALANEAATAFTQTLLGVAPNGLAQVRIAGLSGQLLALDVEQKLADELGSTTLQRAYYGRSYAHAVCTWIRAVQGANPNLIVSLYTTPSVFGEYLDKAFPDDHACLQGLPIWVARTTVDGGDVIRSSDSVVDREAQRLCLVSGGHRCIIHQYSQRGTSRGAQARD